MDFLAQTVSLGKQCNTDIMMDSAFNIMNSHLKQAVFMGHKGPKTLPVFLQNVVIAHGCA